MKERKQCINYAVNLQFTEKKKAKTFYKQQQCDADEHSIYFSLLQIKHTTAGVKYDCFKQQAFSHLHHPLSDQKRKKKLCQSEDV